MDDNDINGVTPDDPLTIGNIMERFPAIKRIIHTAEKIGKASPINPWNAYEVLKAEMSHYVGWDSPDINYATSDAYRVVLGAITDKLNV